MQIKQKNIANQIIIDGNYLKQLKKVAKNMKAKQNPEISSLISNIEDRMLISGKTIIRVSDDLTLRSPFSKNDTNHIESRINKKIEKTKVSISSLNKKENTPSCKDNYKRIKELLLSGKINEEQLNSLIDTSIEKEEKVSNATRLGR